MAALYLTEQGSKLRKASERLVVEKGGTTLLEVPAFGIDRVLIFGAIQLSTQAMCFLMESGIQVSFLSRNGRQSLPLDLIEEFRHPVIDGLVQTLVENIQKTVLNKEEYQPFLVR